MAALPAATAGPLDDVPVSCSAGINDDGRYGAGCGLQANCYSIVWGHHSEFLTVGGGSSCSGGVWADPSKDPGTDGLPVLRDLCVNLLAYC